MGSGLRERKRQRQKKRLESLINYGEYVPNKQERLATYWCHENKIIVYAEGKKQGPWHVMIKLNGKLHKSPQTYPETEVIKKVFEFYSYYYEKYRQ